MRSSSISFFATPGDLQQLLFATEKKCELQYVECGLFEQEEHNPILGLGSVSSLGTAVTGKSIREVTYLVLQRSEPVLIRPVPQRKGGTKYAIDQLKNPSSVVFRPGGIYSDIAIVEGMVGTVSKSHAALHLMETFSREIKGRFRRVKASWVGPSAFQAGMRGVRLTASIVAPVEFDLKP